MKFLLLNTNLQKLHLQYLSMKKIKKLFLNDKFILLIICLNTITIFSEGFQGIDDKTMYIITLIDVIFTLMFIIEAVIKISHYNRYSYFSSHWNKLDFILVVLSLPSILLLFVKEGYVDLSFLLVFRVSRVFKFLRFFKFIPGITNLAKGVKRALKTSVVVLFGFIVYNFIISVLSCYMFNDISPEHFGDPVTSFYSTFKVFTVEGWYEIPDKMTAEISGMKSFFIKLYFIIILITGGIFGLSIVNSIFVDSMVSDNNDELEKKIDKLNTKTEVLIKQNNQTK